MAEKVEDINYIQYKYRVEWSYNCVHDGKTYDLLPSQIHVIVIDKFYDKLNMPVLYVNTNIDKNMLDKMIDGQEEDTIYMKLSRYNVDDPSETAIDYFNKRFVYFLNTDDTNYTKNYDYDDEKDKERDDIYVRLTIGLMDYEAIDNNQRVNYGVMVGSIVDGIRIETFKNIDVIHRYTKHMKMLIEPMDPKDLDEMQLTPVQSVSKIIKEIDDYKTLYNTPYRFFIDFDKAYLVSSSGIITPAIDEDIYTIICDIIDAEIPEDQGMAEYNDAYIFNVNSKFTSHSSDRNTNKIALNINTVTGVGNLKDENLLKNVSANKNIGVKTSQLVRIRNFNDMKTDTTVSDIDTNMFQLIIKKAHVDTHVFTINKEFYINNHSSKAILDGKYIISRAEEIYSFEENELVCMLVLLLRKL